jgi:hypothetical protein
MTDELTQAAVATWAARQLPARLDVAATAKLLGFAEHDIQVLMAAGKLTPLGDPAPNAPKWFCAIEVIRLAMDRDWLHKATREISKHWRGRRKQRISLPAAYVECSG